ncbi:MAG: 1-deoxy-D-xylulose-5-phosphate synthase [Firmicutes bacterium]|nr:1-deoxy-D-xylulose-5-phosphate synthase [Bacillota bacterium]MCL5039084.1 1-deoxy-D-xylulose-5-phosphate synthase [Bacillota bacterium]
MSSRLELIKDPENLKGLSGEELEQLAREIRQVIIETVSRNGGHLAPSLGAVELTLALHTVFESPRDKIIWDVGHQTYAHKLLTGRQERFATLRQYGGLSGYPKRSESPHDIFETGHSSTSISAALGLAKARDLAKEDWAVVAVIGDGALTGGMSFEALNHAGHDGTRLIIVVNDNHMSIAPNVGALSSYLNRLRLDPSYRRFKSDIQGVLKKVPLVGGILSRSMERIKDAFKYLLVPGVIFEELGYTYFGPIDGHDIVEMQRVFLQAKSLRGPVVIHVLTQKGRGYPLAEDKPEKFHGPSPFEVATGLPLLAAPQPSYSEALGRYLTELAEQNQRVVAITAAMPAGTGLAIFRQRFPERFFDVGIAEQHAVTFAAGLAVAGWRPVFAVYSTFLQRALDQVIHDVALQNLPVLFAVDRAGIVGEDGATHQGLYDLAFLRYVPNLTIMAPRDELELKAMLQLALSLPGPAVLRYPRGRVEGANVPLLTPPTPGRAEILLEGEDLVVWAYGAMVHPTLRAAEILARENIHPTVVNARFLQPLDLDLLAEQARKCPLLATVEEHVLTSGFGSALLEGLNHLGVSGVEVKRLGVPDLIVDHGSRGQYLKHFGLTEQGIANSLRSFYLGRSRVRLERRRPGRQVATPMKR